jgi:hypothetical protein
MWLSGTAGPAGNRTAAGAVREFVSRFGSRNSGAIAGLFAEDAVFEIRGLGVVLSGRAAIRELAGYGAEVRSQMRLQELFQVGDTIQASLVETNDWLVFLSVPAVTYRARFVFRRGRIVEAVVEPELESKEALKVALADFIFWLTANDPVLLGRVLPGGKLRLDRATARLLLDVLKTRQLRSR